MEHRVSITISGRGREAENGDKLLGAFHDLDSEVDAVVDQNLETGHLTVTFFVDADSATGAVESGAVIFADALFEATLPLTQVVDVHASLASDDAEPLERELEPAGA